MPAVDAATPAFQPSAFWESGFQPSRSRDAFQRTAFQHGAFQETDPTGAFQGNAFQWSGFQIDTFSPIAGIVSAEAFGSDDVLRGLAPVGIATAEAAGHVAANQGTSVLELGDGSCLFKGMLFSGSWDNIGPNHVYRWLDPTNAAGYTQSASVGAGKLPISLRGDATTNKVYLANAGQGISNVTFLIQSVDPSTLAISTLRSLATGLSSSQAAQTCAITTDGTYMYVIVQGPVGVNAHLFKLKLSDGTTVASYQLTTSGADGGNAITYDPATGFIFCAGGISGSWVAKVATDFSSESVQFLPEIAAPDDDLMVFNGYVYVPNAATALIHSATALDVVAKCSTADLSYSTFEIGQPNYGIDGMDNDGTRLIFGSRVDLGVWPSATTSPITIIDPTTLTPTAVYTVPMIGVNEIHFVPGGFIAYNSPHANNGGTYAASTIVYQPTTNDAVLFVVAPVGIATAQAFGIATVVGLGGIYTITAAGAIASAEAFGVTRVIRILAAIGITSGQAFGTTHVQFVLEPVGVATREAFGTARIVRNANPVGIASSEAFGTTKVIRLIYPVGIASAEAFGVPKLVTTIIRSAGGIQSAEAFGTTKVIRLLYPIGVASAQAVGTPWIAVLWGQGIPSAQAFGTTRVDFVVAPLAITSREAFGQAAQVRWILNPIGVGSIEGFGTTKLIRIIYPIGIASSEAFGRPLLTSGIYFITGVGAIPSAEVFGITHVLFIVRSIGIATSQAFGTTQTLRLVQRAGAISSSEAFGTTRARFIVGVIGLPSREAFGTPTKSPQIIWTQGIASQEAFGVAVIAAVLFASAYGKVFLSDVAVFALNLTEGTVFAAGVDTAQVYAQTLTDTPVYRQDQGDQGVYAGRLDDTPGG